MTSAALRSRVTAWIADDPDERDRADLAALLEAADREAGPFGDPEGGAARAGEGRPDKAGRDDPSAGAELADRFAGRLAFGTAGLRGAVAAGPNRMNRAVVRGATAALAGWLPQQYPGTDVARAGVVIGCDARHRSDEFAAEAAAVLAGAGIRALLLPPRQPTPLLAFAVRHLGAAAGVMITASHNPRADNGYKLYLADGAQIIPPADAQIEAAIAGLGPLAAVPVAGPDSPEIVRLGDEVARAYLDAVCAVSPAPPGAAWLRIVYTPLHGVAAGLALRAFEQAGYTEPDVVEAQQEPDPDFPTVAFPNPEEPGALDLAVRLARRSDADLVLASDPDGDRLAVAVPDPGVPGGWRTLTGDQVGALLGAYLLGELPGDPPGGPARGGPVPDGPVPGDPRPEGRAQDRLVVTTIVSSTLLSRVAAAAGARYAQALTGFKWIVRAGQEPGGPRFVFGYEEALGYAVTAVVRDKDGIGAALAVLGLATRARARGETLLDAWDALEAAHGVHLTTQLTVATRAPAELTARLRGAAPTFLGRLAVTSVTDFSGGSRELPPTDALGYRVGRDRVVIRPSGTEPKLKAYLEVVEPVPPGQLGPARQAAAARMEALQAAVRQLLAQ
jgi:phosphomannomutase